MSRLAKICAVIPPRCMLLRKRIVLLLWFQMQAKAYSLHIAVFRVHFLARYGTTWYQLVATRNSTRLWSQSGLIDCFWSGIEPLTPEERKRARRKETANDLQAFRVKAIPYCLIRRSLVPFSFRASFSSFQFKEWSTINCPCRSEDVCWTCLLWTGSAWDFGMLNSV